MLQRSLQWYIMSWHRVIESVRKGRAISWGPRLVQGMKGWVRVGSA